MNNPKTFLHLLGAAVALALSGEKGIIVGRAEYSDGSEDGYQVRYVDATGHQKQSWFGESAIEASDEIEPGAVATAQHGAIPVTGIAPPPRDGVERDVNGLPWDQRIHGSAKNKNKDGSWKNIKGVDKTLLAQVEAQLKSTSAAPVPAATTTLPLPGASIPLPGALVPALPPANPEFTNFVAFIAQHTKSDTNPAGRLTDEWVKATLLGNGVAGGELQNLAANPALIAPIFAGIRAALGV